MSYNMLDYQGLLGKMEGVLLQDSRVFTWQLTVQ